MQCKDLRDLKGRGPWAVASERNKDATKGPRPFNYVDPYAACLTCLDLRTVNLLDNEI